MHARIDSPALTGHRRTRCAAGTEQRGQADRHLRDDAGISSSCARARSTAAASASTSTPASSEVAGERDARIFSVAAWREAPYYTDAERAALALTEAATRLADRPDAVSDELWDAVGPALRRAAAGRSRARDRGDQHLEPAQRGHAAGLGRVDRGLARSEVGGDRGRLTTPTRSRLVVADAEEGDETATSLRGRLDEPRHDPAMLADLAIANEAQLLVGGQGPVEEEAGGHGAGVLRVALDRPAALECLMRSSAPASAAVATPGVCGPCRRSSRRSSSPATTCVPSRMRHGS